MGLRCVALDRHQVIGLVAVTIVRAVSLTVCSASMVITFPAMGASSRSARTAAISPPSSWKASPARGSPVPCSTRVAVSWRLSPFRFAPLILLPLAARAPLIRSWGKERHFSTASSAAGSALATTRCRVDFDTGTNCPVPGLRQLPSASNSA